MKTIGIFTRIEKLNGRNINYVPQDIILKLRKKVQVIIIPFTILDNLSDILNVIEKCDGIILPGGDDIYPIEIEVSKYAYEKDLPCLGICLGMQTMACAINGKMGHLPNLNHKNLNEYVHSVTINKNSKLFNILNKENIMVNSRHKDYIISTKLNIGALSEDGIIEEIEDNSKRFFIGVQWHPENLDDDNSIKLFEYFINVL